MQQPRYTNRLIHEKSPYLLQHAHNPVDWYPWGEEAFNTAKENDKPILLSIGYSTCHWCHVMEKESFEDPEIAEMLNETFINIKIDREELPEVDSLYMEFAQSMMSGAAGWPLNVILTPSLEPFFAATYMPPTSKHGLMGISELVQRIRHIWWSDDRKKILSQAERIVEVFQDNAHTKGIDFPKKDVIDSTIDILLKLADPVYGGMKGVPKFPIGYQYNFLLRFAKTTGDGRSFFFVQRTLDMMHRGGIFDHLAGGFSRYSVDEHWLIPHFEKMLYDNALLIFSYLETWQAGKQPLYKKVAQEIIEYILTTMTNSLGGFYSAEDADSEGKEGYYYTWEEEEIKKILGQEESEFFVEYYGVTHEGNFEGRNILNTPVPLPEFASHKGADFHALEELLTLQKQALLEERGTRVKPIKDDKIITAWNGLTIFSLAEAGRAFGEERYLQAAENSAQFIYKYLWKEGILYRRWRDNEPRYQGSLDDYAYLIHGLISLFEADRGVFYLKWALALTNILQNEFKEENGAYFSSGKEHQHLLIRRCLFADGAEPSANAVHAENLIRLYQITLNPNYLEQAEDIFKAVNKYLDVYSPGYCYHLIALQRYYNTRMPTFIIALNEKEDNKDRILQLIYQNFIPHKAIIVKRVQDEELTSLLPYIRDKVPIDGKTTLYTCYQGVCLKPLSNLEEISKALEKQ
ncbi:thioredoxin domain-containing protein [Criblamydia sequanensis]|uniref:Spermatogenesis-associated protein 20-like TRX domain-containing protein n=1 Tax=Candidatus Criblamydia sequanensis CRIB-18 TaxID=1437425 RepID=A0A090DX24_9BACT|nr:thioredoxin domain-containing protein [Criblamydia sequanensis]CDR33384.1 Conserved hypothetical protein [Criblamydia sequanensis CRIB-18]